MTGPRARAAFGELARTGIVYAVDKNVGSMRTLTLFDLAVAERDGLLANDFIKPSLAEALACAAGVRAAILRNN